MKKSYFTTSLELRNLIEKFNKLHEKVLLKTIPPKLEIKLQSEARINRMYHTLKLSDIDSRRSRITELLFHHKGNNKNERMILDMQHFIDTFYYEWTLYKDVIHVEFVSKIIFAIEKRRITYNTISIENDLAYIQLEESPLIQAALAYLLFISELNNPTAIIMSTLISWLFLFKGGYHFRRMISFQKTFTNDRKNYTNELENALKGENITHWILYFCHSFIKTIEEELAFIDNLSEESPLQTNVLSDRHIQILSLFSDNQKSITNKKIQSIFNVSQITASRDLTYLTSLGLLLVQGRGRSIKYLKI